MQRIMTRLFAISVASIGLAVPVPGQGPAHATLLNPTLAMNAPVLLHDGDVVHAFGRGSSFVVYARSRDGGRTWPLREFGLGPHSSQAADRIMAAKTDPTTLLVLANDQVVGPVLWRSTDAGTTWSTAAPLFSPSAPAGNGTIALLVDGAAVVAVWLRHASGEVQCRRSTDGGASWLASQTIEAVAPSSSGDSLGGWRHGNTIDLLWNKWPSGTVRQRSTDGGVTWLPTASAVSPIQMTFGTSDGTNLLVVLVSTGILHSSNGGNTFVPRTIPGMYRAQSLDQEGALMLCVGTAANGFFANTYVFSVSSDGGMTWSASPLLLPTPSVWPIEARVEDGIAYARWLVNPAFGVVTSRNGGASWQLVGGPADGGLWPGVQRNLHLRVDQSLGTTVPRYEAYVGIGSSRLGVGTAGTGGIAPELRGQGLPFQGSTTTLQVEHALGGSLGAIAVSFAAPVPLPFGTATVWPTVSPIVFGFATGGVAGQPGTGAFGLPITIPVATSLVGTSFTSQGFVIDASNVEGIAVSNAIETWLR
jgi:hypothetical protein